MKKELRDEIKELKALSEELYSMYNLGTAGFDNLMLLGIWKELKRFNDAKENKRDFDVKYGMRGAGRP